MILLWCFAQPTNPPATHTDHLRVVVAPSEALEYDTRDSGYALLACGAFVICIDAMRTPHISCKDGI